PGCEAGIFLSAADRLSLLTCCVQPYADFEPSENSIESAPRSGSGPKAAPCCASHNLYEHPHSEPDRQVTRGLKQYAGHDVCCLQSPVCGNQTSSTGCAHRASIPEKYLSVPSSSAGPAIHVPLVKSCTCRYAASVCGFLRRCRYRSPGARYSYRPSPVS